MRFANRSQGELVRLTKHLSWPILSWNYYVTE